jgi:hypothetical protein
MHPAERGFAIQIDGKNQFVSGPGFAFVDIHYGISANLNIKITMSGSAAVPILEWPTIGYNLKLLQSC